jgi:hypothetical protein
MTKGHLLLLLFAIYFSFLLTGNTQTVVKPGASGDTPQSQSTSSAPAPPFAVCQGTFALCTEAVCDPVITTTADGRKNVGFSCRCKVQVGYSVGGNVPKNAPCQSVPTAAPTVGQKVPSRYVPIKSYVACNNQRPWAWCLDSACVVDHVDKNDPTKGTANCACRIATGAPYVYIPSDGKYSRAGCDKEYVSSATVDDALQVTEFLTTPAGTNLPPSLPTLLTPSPTPTPIPTPTPAPTH